MEPPVPEPEPLSRADIDRLRAEVMSLNRHMQRMVTNEVAEKAVPRQELHDRLRASAKRTIAAIVLVLVLCIGAVVLNRVTLVQSREDFTEAVTVCFLRPGAITAAQAAECDRRFGDGQHSYMRLQEQSRQAQARFADLQRWAESKGWKPPQPPK